MFSHNQLLHSLRAAEPQYFIEGGRDFKPYGTKSLASGDQFFPKTAFSPSFWIRDIDDWTKTSINWRLELPEEPDIIMPQPPLTWWVEFLGYDPTVGDVHRALTVTHDFWNGATTTPEPNPPVDYRYIFADVTAYRNEEGPEGAEVYTLSPGRINLQWLNPPGGASGSGGDGSPPGSFN